MSRCVKRSRVPAPFCSRSISIVEEPGGTGFGPSGPGSQPHVKTRRCGGSSSTNSPLAVCPGITPTRYSPPGRGSNDALCPIQRVALSSSTRNDQTVSGLASIAISRTTDAVLVALSMLPLLLSFGLLPEHLETIAPEVVQERLQVGESGRVRSVGPFGPVAPLAHESGLLQDS